MRPILKDAHVPEQSFEYWPATQMPKQSRQWQVSEPLREYADSTLRPSVLLEQPVPLAETVRIIHGPERVQTAWWQDQAVTRDYFVALNEYKQLLWVFRDAEQQWFVHGLFA